MKSEARCATMLLLLERLKPRSRAEACSIIGAHNMLRWVLQDDLENDVSMEEIERLYPLPVRKMEGP